MLGEDNNVDEDIFKMNKEIRREEESDLGKYLLTPEAKHHKKKSRLREFDTASTGQLPDDETVRACLFNDDDDVGGGACGEGQFSAIAK